MLGVRLVLIALVLLGGCDEADDSSLTALKPGRLRLDRETVAFFPTPQLFTQTFDLQLYNSGQTELIFESIEFQPQLNAFVINNPPVKLAPKEGVLMSITFAPGDAVVHESDLQFRFDGDNSPLSIPVTGTGQVNPACAPCDAPPASFCMSDEVLALYERADGACEEGMCAYEVQDVRCTVSCDVDQGACLDLDAGPSGGTPNPNPNPISENDSGPETPGGEGGTGTPGGDVDAGNLADPEDAGPEPVFRIAHSNPEQCYTCTDWGNPTTCSIAMTNCPLPGSDGYGQEIHYPQAGPVELLPSSDVLLQDPKTGLSWWRCANGGANTPCDADQDRVTFAGAQQRCAQLTAEDGTALRVPTLGELLTIVNYESQTGLMDLPIGSANWNLLDPNRQRTGQPPHRVLGHQHHYRGLSASNGSRPSPHPVHGWRPLGVKWFYGNRGFNFRRANRFGMEEMRLRAEHQHDRLLHGNAGAIAAPRCHGPLFGPERRLGCSVAFAGHPRNHQPCPLGQRGVGTRFWARSRRAVGTLALGHARARSFGHVGFFTSGVGMAKRWDHAHISVRAGALILVCGRPSSY